MNNDNDDNEGDIILNQVRVPSAYNPVYTYYETLYWYGTAGGYAGIQNTNGSPNPLAFIISIWDNPNQSKLTTAVYLGYGTQASRFGGEGTGLHALNYQLGWEPDSWETTLIRCWPVGGDTYFAYWVRDGVSNIWYHLVTMDVGATCDLTGRSGAFLEDYGGNGLYREMNLRQFWRRWYSDGSWHAAVSENYQVIQGDINGGRSSGESDSWDGGVATDATGSYYYIISGGAAIEPKNATTSTGEDFSVSVTGTQPNYPEGSISQMTATLTSPTQLTINWTPEPTGLPQYNYKIEVFDNPSGTGTALLSYVPSNPDPDSRSYVMDVSSLNTALNYYYVRLTITDIFDQVPASVTTQFGS